MKKNIVRFALCLTALMAGTQLFAESHGLLRVSVPFEFTVGGTKMPAGDYSIEETGGAALLIHCLSSRRSIMVLSSPGTVPAGKARPEPDLRTPERHSGSDQGHDGFGHRPLAANGPLSR